MTSYLTAIDSTLTPRAAFDYMASFEHAAEWDPGVVEASRIDDGPLGLASEFHVLATFGSRTLPLTYKITVFEHGTRVVLTAETSTLRSVDEITVSASGEGSCVTYNADLRLRGLLWIGNPLLGLAFKKIGDRARTGLERELNP
jgi:hypothetical protein